MHQTTLIIICILCIASPSLQQQSSPKKRGGKKDGSNSAAIEDLKKQIDNIVLELNVLKEQQALQTVCLKGIKVPGKCFLVDESKKNFHAANDVCNSMGGVLSRPLSGDENNKLHEYVRQYLGPDEHIWLGLNDMVKEGEWLDQSGTFQRYMNWETEITKQPTGGRAYNCATLSLTSGRWFDENCREEMSFACEFKIV